MFKDILLFIKDPYAAGIIVVIWLGSAGFLALTQDLDLIHVVLVDIVATLLIALLGFGDKKKL